MIPVASYVKRRAAMGMKGHKPGCRCVGCSVQTRARGTAALRGRRGLRLSDVVHRTFTRAGILKPASRRNPLTRMETAKVIRWRRQAERKAAEMLRGGSLPLEREARGRASAFDLVRNAFGARRSLKTFGGNPLAGLRVIGPIPGQLLEIRYRRQGQTVHPGLYKHAFRRGVQAFALSDGSILIRGAKPVWVKQ